MSNTGTPPPPPLSSDEMLPPVHPPGAGFLVQLFVIPGLIVLVMVLVWMLIKWLPQMGNDAEANVRALSGSGANRWQAAVNLANLLQTDSVGNLKRDPKLAAELAAKLKAELAAGETSEDAVLLRVYLATALGEFYVDTGLPVLIEAVTTEENSEQKPSVRVAAARAIAVLSNNLRRETGTPIADSDAVAALVEASREDDSLLRTTTTFALGEIGGSAADERLKTLLDDVSHPYARYNAATALARRGDPAAIDAIVEMLGTKEPPETSEKDTKQEQDLQRSKLVTAGLRAASDLAEANPEVDLSRLTSGVEALTNDQSREIRNHAKALVARLEKRGERVSKASSSLN
jgi:hypothetical protein